MDKSLDLNRNLRKHFGEIDLAPLLVRAEGIDELGFPPEVEKG